MVYWTKKRNVAYNLSEAAWEEYEKIKALILRIFTLLKKQETEKDLKEQFYDSYINFARKLDQEGYKNESNFYMNICAMYYDLMDRPEELMTHEMFFMDFFNAFDDLLFIRINQPEKYEDEVRNFLKYYGKMQQYYYTNVAVPSQNYDKAVCKEIIGPLLGEGFE